MLKLHELNKYSVMTDDARFVGVWIMHTLVCWNAKLLVFTSCAQRAAVACGAENTCRLQHNGFCLDRSCGALSSNPFALLAALEGLEISSHAQALLAHSSRFSEWFWLISCHRILFSLLVLRKQRF